MCLYKLRQDVLHTNDVGLYISYGVDVFKNNRIILSVKDIALDKMNILDFINKCNSLKLAPCHLDDAIEDFLP